MNLNPEDKYNDTEKKLLLSNLKKMVGTVTKDNYNKIKNGFYTDYIIKSYTPHQGLGFHALLYDNKLIYKFQSNENEEMIEELNNNKDIEANRIEGGKRKSLRRMKRKTNKNQKKSKKSQKSKTIRRGRR